MFLQAWIYLSFCALIMLTAVSAVKTSGDGACAKPLVGVALGGTDNLPSSFPVGKTNGTVAVCCQACNDDKACQSWTLNLAQKPHMCWLKATQHLNHGKPDGKKITSGIKPAAPLPPCKGRCPNILHLMSDDMRPQLGAYGHTFMRTPHLDKLAQTGLQFDFAYTQFAYCAPSRNSFMSGRRPERTRALNFLSTFRQAPGGETWTTMPQFFKKHGYFTSSAGKIFHDGMDDPESWTYPSNQTRWIGCVQGDLFPPRGVGRNFCGVTNRSRIPYTDEDLALEEGLRRMELAVASGKPWWVSIGVHRPHTTYRVPPSFYGPEIYPPGSIPHLDPVQPPAHPNPPSGVPYMAGNWQGGDISDVGHGCPSCLVSTNNSIHYRRWYYAAVSWADHSLGRALTRLETLGVANNTITIFHSDHGYQLGELNEWSKKTNTELATHVPLLIRVPWKTNSLGRRTTVKTELVDLYRTLADLAELSSSPPSLEDSVQGMSVAHVFDDPDAPHLQTKRAYSQIGRCDCGDFCPGGPVNSIEQNYCPCQGKNQCGGPASSYFTKQTPPGSSELRVTGPPRVRECGGNACCKVPLASGQYDFMGYSLRSADRRFTAWVAFNKTTLRVDWDQVMAKELYDLSKDTGRDFDFDGYSTNLALETNHSEEVAELLSDLKTEVLTWY